MQKMQLMHILPYLFMEENIYISVKMNIKTYKKAVFFFPFKNLSLKSLYLPHKIT